MKHGAALYLQYGTSSLFSNDVTDIQFLRDTPSHTTCLLWVNDKYNLRLS